jgi:glycosyltransferase involved in cell wall biosynthesis
MNPMPVPVLIMVRELNLGGVERDAAKIAIHLDRSRFQPYVGTFQAHGQRYEELRAAGVPVVHFPLLSVYTTQYLRSSAKLWRFIRSNGIRIVHSYDASGIMSVPVARAAGVPVVISSQLSYREILDRSTKVLSRMTDYLADAVLVNCEAIRHYMIESQHVKEGRVELCYNGVATADFYPAQSPRPVELADATLVIGTVCVLRPEKALTLLQEAFARVSRLKPGMKLVLVGSGAQLPVLQSNAERLGLGRSCVLIPATREVAMWMRAMDVFVLPSYSEAFSNALLEAMACGCAVVGSRVGGTPELIGANEERGLLFESGNVEELANKLGIMAGDESLRREFGRQAAKFVRENLTIEIASERTASMYERILLKKTAIS